MLDDLFGCCSERVLWVVGTVACGCVVWLICSV